MKMEDQSKKSRREDVCPSKKGKLDLDSARAQIAATQGPEYWRSLEELAGSEDFQEMLHREFPKGASEWLDTVSRRGFLKVMGASLGLAGMTACTKLPLEPIVPYVRQPEGVIPGRPMYYATAVTLGGYANPVLVESHLGRPTKIAGRDPWPLRSRPLAERRFDGRPALGEGISRCDPRTAGVAESLAGRGHSHP